MVWPVKLPCWSHTASPTGGSFSGNVPSPLGGGGGFGGGGTASVSVQLAGPDLATLNQISDQVIATMSTIPGMVDVQNSSNAGNPDGPISKTVLAPAAMLPKEHVTVGPAVALPADAVQVPPVEFV